MHQTFYLDIDEEITSVVDRLRKAKAKELIMVVPKRALLIQSIVNLKLLKKESDNLRKDIVIVTQDELGKSLVEKAGIAVEQRLDDIGGEEVTVPAVEMSSESDEFLTNEASDDEMAREKHRLEKMGSSDYFEQEMLGRRKRYTSAPIKKPADPSISSEKIINRELVANVGVSNEEKKAVGKTSSMDIVRNLSIGNAADEPGLPIGNDFFRSKSKPKTAAPVSLIRPNELRNQLFSREEKEVPKRDFFRERMVRKAEPPKQDYKNVNIGGGFWKFFFIFGSLAALIAALVVAYLFVPKVSLKLSVKTKSQSIDAQIKASKDASEINFEEKIIPARQISVSEELTENFAASGQKNSSNQKARGTVTIYNEYSSSPQPLVATTRFLSEGGKLFRLVKGVSVPGTTTVGGEIKPGAIEAEVVADEPGEEYNIGPSKFTIPGFESSGSGKYSKIYAQSYKPMTGGGSGGEKVKSVTAVDIEKAKNKLHGDLIVRVKEKVKQVAGAGSVALEDGINAGDATYTLSNAEGELADNFSVTVKINAEAMVFSEQDLAQVISQMISKTTGADQPGNLADINFDFGKADADFSAGTMLIRLNAKTAIKPDIDVEKLKTDIVGKNENALQDYLKAYPEITQVELKYWPFSIGGRLPAHRSRIDIQLDYAASN